MPQIFMGTLRLTLITQNKNKDSENGLSASSILNEASLDNIKNIFSGRGGFSTAVTPNKPEENYCSSKQDDEDQPESERF